jgi:hypothetical protein
MSGSSPEVPHVYRSGAFTAGQCRLLTREGSPRGIRLFGFNGRLKESKSEGDGVSAAGLAKSEAHPSRCRYELHN